jgi:hypothetical protein
MVEADGPENLARTTACGVPGFGGASQKSPDDTQESNPCRIRLRASTVGAHNELPAIKCIRGNFLRRS